MAELEARPACHVALRCVRDLRPNINSPAVRGISDAWQGAERAFAFTSGMAALTAVTRLVGAGERVLSGDDIYGGTSRLLAQVLPKQGISITNVDMTDLAAVQGASREARSECCFVCHAGETNSKCC